MHLIKPLCHKRGATWRCKHEELGSFVLSQHGSDMVRCGRAMRERSNVVLCCSRRKDRKAYHVWIILSLLVGGSGNHDFLVNGTLSCKSCAKTQVAHRIVSRTPNRKSYAESHVYTKLVPVPAWLCSESQVAHRTASRTPNRNLCAEVQAALQNPSGNE